MLQSPSTGIFQMFLKKFNWIQEQVATHLGHKMAENIKLALIGL